MGTGFPNQQCKSTEGTEYHVDKNSHIASQKYRSTLILLRFKIHHWKCTH